eukprot:Clim_evm115s128 gene=Clim_evmTU115s128
MGPYDQIRANMAQAEAGPAAAAAAASGNGATNHVAPMTKPNSPRALLQDSQWEKFRGIKHEDIAFNSEKSNELLSLFLRTVAEMGVKVMVEGRDSSTPVTRYKNPDQLLAKLSLDLKTDGTPIDEMLKVMDTIAQNSVKSGHRRFHNQLFAGLDPLSLAGDWLTAVLNTSMYTYEMAPIFVMMEQEVIKKITGLCGWDPETSDGIFNPGGSFSNFLAIHTARHWFDPNLRKVGMTGARLAIFASRQAHYSIKKASFFLGFGTDSIYLVDCDQSGNIIPEALEASIQKAKDDGARPFLVMATSGTTVKGAFDDLEAIAAIKDREGMWGHVDAAWGGATLLSQKLRHLIKGIEKMDSLSWSAHKTLSISQQCSVMVTKHRGIMSEQNSTNATYLFQKDKDDYPVHLDSGDKSLQCGRKVDVFRLWLQWMARGDNGMAAHIDRAYALTQYLADQVEARDGFTLLERPLYLNTCFVYTPKAWRDIDDQEKVKDLINQVPPYVKRRMMERGTTMCNYQPIGGLNMWRMIVHSDICEKIDLDQFLDEVEILSEEFLTKQQK